MECNIAQYKDLNKKFKIIAFDWDGTAVISRHSDASAAFKIITELLKMEVIIVIITGTNLNNIQAQPGFSINDGSVKNLYICTNRGSEVWQFNEKLEPFLLYYRKATKKENYLLNKVVENTKTDIEKTSKINLSIVYDRLNRRKLDLIPEWPNPPKHEISELLHRTEYKLESCGVSGGIKKVFKMMETMAKSCNFSQAKITSDVKHIEIGLTDKSDSILWILNNIARPNKINNSDILICGDEFGPIGCFEGSDHKMVIKNEHEITYISVGVEPDGVSSPVIGLYGGPDCFIKVLEKQLLY